MRKLIILILFVFIFVHNVFSQPLIIFEHSNNFEEIIRIFQIKAKEISLGYKYFNAGMEKKYLPVLDNKNKEIVGDDKFVILWEVSDILNLNLLFLCDYKENEAIVFHFRNEYMEEYVPCSMIEMSRYLVYYIINLDPKWLNLTHNSPGNPRRWGGCRGSGNR